MHITRRNLLRTAGTLTATIPFLSDQRRANADEGPGRARPPAIRVGQIGVGHAHATKLSVYRDSPDYEVVGIVEPSAELRQSVSQHPAYRDVQWMNEEQLLNSKDLQVVLVETHVRDSLATAARCIAAGKHVHLDKPAGDSLSAYRELLAQAEQRRLMVQMGYMYRYNPAVLLLREFLNHSWLGEIFEVHTVMSKVVGGEDRTQLAEFTGGMMFELGCHIIDLVVGVLGAPDKVTPYAQHASLRDDRLLDNMLAVFEYPRATATVKTSAMEVEGFSRRHFVVCGTKGTFHIQPLDNPTAQVALSEKRGDYTAAYQELTFPKFVRYVADAAEMAEIIRGKKETQFNYAHDLAVQTAVLNAAQMPS